MKIAFSNRERFLRNYRCSRRVGNYRSQTKLIRLTRNKIALKTLMIVPADATAGLSGQAVDLAAAAKGQCETRIGNGLPRLHALL